MPRPRLNQSPEWLALRSHYAEIADRELRDWFGADPERGPAMTVEAAGLVLDYSKNRLSEETVDLLSALARSRGVGERIEAMFRGDRINATEGRAVLHTALRAPRDAEVVVDGENVVPAVHAVLDRMGAFADDVREGRWRGATGERIRHVVNLGIGGSDLGPAMATRALSAYASRELDVRFVSNVDGADFAQATLGLDPAETVYIDDLPANVEAGAVAGLRALPYDRHDHGRLLASLASDFGISGVADSAGGVA